MRRLIAVPMVIALGGSAIGCGEEKTVSDDQIVQALDLKRSDDAPVYEVGGDEFCQVDQELLNDSDEVEQAKKDKNALVVANSTSVVGIQVVPPFDPRCEQDARKALNELGKEED
jgi:predicted transcriptional regulator